MSLNWIDVSNLSFDWLLFLEPHQVSLLPDVLTTDEEKKAFATALRGGNVHVEWYLRHASRGISEWLDGVLALADRTASAAEVRRAEILVMDQINDWMVYVVSPEAYDAQPFLGWDSEELLKLFDFRGSRVLDVGAGTGRLAFSVAPLARVVYALEPVGRLREYLMVRARELGYDNVLVGDGLITRIPFEDDFAEATICGHVYGDEPEREIAELERVTASEGAVILCPGNADVDNDVHSVLVSRGYEWDLFEEPRDGPKRKYWKTMS